MHPLKHIRAVQYLLRSAWQSRQADFCFLTVAVSYKVFYSFDYHALYRLEFMSPDHRQIISLLSFEEMSATDPKKPQQITCHSVNRWFQAHVRPGKKRNRISRGQLPPNLFRYQTSVNGVDPREEIRQTFHGSPYFR